MDKGTSKTTGRGPDEAQGIFGDRVPIKRRPLWMRVVLLLILLAIVGIGFYFANLLTIEYYRNQQE